MSEEEGLIVPKETVAVEMATERGAIVRGEVFTLPFEGALRGERLLDVLARRQFIPVKTAEGLRFVAVRHLAWVKLDLLAAVDELDPVTEDDENSALARVVLELVEGSRLEGRLRYALPSLARRVGDYLEHLPLFFPLTTDDFVYLVSSHSVVSVIALEERR